jgi:beta-phosphoglucomutase-like phosphatase (HAD superfamily)
MTHLRAAHCDLYGVLWRHPVGQVVAGAINALGSARVVFAGDEVRSEAPWPRVGRTVTVVSNNSAAAVQAFVEAEGLSQYFHSIVARTNPDPSLLKPDPHLLLRAAANLEALPATCTLLGDSVTDVEAAHRAGAGSIAFANKPDKRNALLAVRPGATISSLLDVVTALIP